MNKELKQKERKSHGSENDLFSDFDDSEVSNPESIPDENPMGLEDTRRVVDTATAKRKDSIEDEFDIITDEEIKEVTNSRRTTYAPQLNYVYPGTQGVQIRPQTQVYPQTLQPQYNQPAPTYYPPSYNSGYNNGYNSAYNQPAPTYYPPGYNNNRAQPQVVNWAFGKPLMGRVARRVIRNQFRVMRNFTFNR